MTPRLLALAAVAAFATMLAPATANACQPEYCPQTPTCRLLPKTCIRPY